MRWSRAAEARAICALPGSGPVFLAFTLRTRQVHGIWGGIPKEERHSGGQDQPGNVGSGGEPARAGPADRRRSSHGDLAWRREDDRTNQRELADEPDEAPEGFREQPRYAPAVERAYANDRIEVTWEPAFCIHAAECLRGLPAVFDNQRRPWIIVDNGSPGDIGEVIQRCPTGALHFRRLDGGPQEPVPEATTIQERPNGPLFVRGNVTIFGQDHTLVRQDTRVALCRCGASANKPFCDGSHRRVGFRTTRGPA